MKMLLIGVLLWSGIHYIPGFMPDIKEKMVATLGNAYRGVFALLIVISILMMIFGWRGTIVEPIYEPLPDMAQITSVMMVISFYLFGAAHGESNIKRWVRHPMLCGVILWGVAHLLVNGDNRSIVLFAGMIIWAVSEIIIINQRDGAYDAPGPVPMMKDAVKLVAAIVIYAAMVFAHPYITGVPVMMI